MKEIKEIAGDMLASRDWDQKQIFNLLYLCAKARIFVDFGKIFDVYEGREDEYFADKELQKLI